MALDLSTYTVRTFELVGPDGQIISAARVSPIDGSNYELEFDLTGITETDNGEWICRSTIDGPQDLVGNKLPPYSTSSGGVLTVNIQPIPSPTSDSVTRYPTGQIFTINLIAPDGYAIDRFSGVINTVADDIVIGVVPETIGSTAILVPVINTAGDLEMRLEGQCTTGGVWTLIIPLEIYSGVAPTTALIQPDPTTITSAGQQNWDLTVQYSELDNATVANENVELVAPDGTVYTPVFLVDYGLDGIVLYRFDIDFQQSGEWIARVSATNAIKSPGNVAAEANFQIYSLTVTIPDTTPPANVGEGTVVYLTNGSVSAAVITDPNKGRLRTELDVSPDPDSSRPGTTTATIIGDDIFVRLEEQMDPGDYVAIPRALHTDDSIVEGDPIKITIPFVQVWTGSTLLADGDTVRVEELRFHDYRFAAHTNSQIQNLAADVTGPNTNAQIFQVNPIDWRLRLTSDEPGSIQTVLATISLGDPVGDIEFRFYALVPDPEPETVEITGVSPQETVEWNRDVSATFGPGNEAKTLVGIDYGVYRYDGGVVGQAMSSASISSYSPTAEVNWRVQSYGEFAIVITWRYSDGTTTQEITPFSNPAPSQEPHQTVLLSANTEIYLDSQLVLTAYVDHQHEVTKQELLVNGTPYAMGESVGTKTIVLNLDSVGMASAGAYALKYHVELADTTPTFSDSEELTITVQNVPVATLLSDAAATPSDNTAWQSVISSPLSTAKQKAVAQQAINLNNEIAAGVFDQPGSPVSTVQATANRDTWIAEEIGKDNPLTFSEWLQAQAVWDAAEQQQTREFLLGAPTSSINALLNYFNSTIAPFGSHLQAVLAGRYGIGGGDYEFIRGNAQSYGGEVPDQIVLTDYARYQSALPNMNPVIEFEGWIIGGN